MKSQFREILRIIRRHKRFLISFHKNPDGDALANALLWARYLQRKGKKYRIVTAEGLPDSYSFLERRYTKLFSGGFTRIANPKDWDRRMPKAFESAPLIMLDSTDISRAGPLSARLSNRQLIINIDHHIDNTRFGTVNYVDSKAAAVSEISMRFFKETGTKTDKVMDELAYISLHSDTGGFTQPNTSRSCLALLHGLIGRKVDVRPLNSALQARSSQKTLLIGRVLSAMESAYEGRLLWSRISRKDLSDCGVKPWDTDGLIDEMVKSQGSSVILLFKETGKNNVKVSFRSSHGIDVRRVAKRFGGGGHKAAAGAELGMGLDAAVVAVLAELRKKAGRALSKRT